MEDKEFTEAIGNLKSAGVIAIHNGKIEIIDESKMKKFYDLQELINEIYDKSMEKKKRTILDFIRLLQKL